MIIHGHKSGELSRNQLSIRSIAKEILCVRHTSTTEHIVEYTTDTQKKTLR